MFTFSHDTFFQMYVATFAPLKPVAASGLEALLGFLEEDPDVNDVRWAAYMLATVKHECADRWQPIEEFGKGKGHPYGQPVNVADDDGTQYTNQYYGRGYVQLTWKLNYDKMSRALDLGNGLVLHPEHALEPQTAYRIMSYGMRQGSFTGKKLQDYIHDDICDYLHARRIINALDKAALIQGYAQELGNLLNESLAASGAIPSDTPNSAANAAGG